MCASREVSAADVMPLVLFILRLAQRLNDCRETIENGAEDDPQILQALPFQEFFGDRQGVRVPANFIPLRGTFLDSTSLIKAAEAASEARDGGQ